MRHLLKAFFRPQVVFKIPPGIVPDNVGMWGLYGLANNVNNYAVGISSVATAGTNTTLIAAQLLSGLVQLNSGASGPFTITLPSTQSIIAALGPTIALDGSYSEPVRFVNNLTGQPGTLVAGDTGTTIVGAAIIGSNVCRDYIMQVLGSSSISVTNVGQAFL